MIMTMAGKAAGVPVWGARRGGSVILAVLLALPAGAAAADPELIDRYTPLVARCLAQAEPEAQHACIGVAATACMEGEEGGQSTLGMSMCTDAETGIWDARLNAEYDRTMGAAQAMDAEDLEIFPEYARRADALRTAQRAWIAFRDAECALEYARWGAGSMRHVSGATCHLQLTAERAIELRAKREIWQ